MSDCLRLNSYRQLFRYISEWNPRDQYKTKGGYLEGSIRIPDELLGSDLVMIIQTHPNECHIESGNNFHEKCVHPCLLHVVRMGRGRRENEKEPIPNSQHWRQVFEITNGEVRIINATSSMDETREFPIPKKDLVTRLNGNQITLGRSNGDLNLVILLPKTSARAREGEVCIRKVIQQRIGVDDKNLIDIYENKFKGKNSLNLKRVRLLISFWRKSDNYHISNLSSHTIIDTGNKEIGAMDFYDATPLKSCVQGGRKVILVSEYNLSKDVEPIFQAWDKNDQHRSDMDNFIAQPNQVVIKKESLIFITPPQPNFGLTQGMKIKLVVRRKTDGHISKTKFPFGYISHQEGQCIFCNYGPDTDGPLRFAQLEPEKARPKPGTPKRPSASPSTSKEIYNSNVKLVKTCNGSYMRSQHSSDGSRDSCNTDSPKSVSSVSNIFSDDPYPFGNIYTDPSNALNVTQYPSIQTVESIYPGIFHTEFPEIEDLFSESQMSLDILPVSLSAIENQQIPHPHIENLQDCPTDTFLTLGGHTFKNIGPDIQEKQILQRMSHQEFCNNQLFSTGEEMTDNIQSTFHSKQIPQNWSINPVSSTGKQQILENMTPKECPINQLLPPGGQIPISNNQNVHDQERLEPMFPHPQVFSTNPLLTTGGQINVNIRRTFLEERDNSYFPNSMDISKKYEEDFSTMQEDGQTSRRNRYFADKVQDEKSITNTNKDTDEKTDEDGLMLGLLQYSRFFTFTFMLVFIGVDFIKEYFKEYVNDGKGNIEDVKNVFLSPVRTVTVIVSLATALALSFVKYKIA